jgi:hypothetical protein
MYGSREKRFLSIPLRENLIKHYFFDTLYFLTLLITIRTEYAELSEIVWRKLYKISKIIENLKSDRPKSKPFSWYSQIWYSGSGRQFYLNSVSAQWSYFCLIFCLFKIGEGQVEKSQFLIDLTWNICKVLKKKLNSVFFL